jgi:hypothetical protein
MIAFHSAPKGEFVAEVLEMAVMDRVGEAMRRALPLLPSEARSTVMAMLQPQALAIIAGTLVVWAGSHFFGVGEIVDIILLVVGFAALGMSVFSGASELTDFVEKAVNGRSDADLDQAAEHFAKAISLLGISAIQALLMRGAARTVIERGIPKVEPLPNVGTPPPAGNALRLSRPETLPGGSLGSTGVFGEISVGPPLFLAAHGPLASAARPDELVCLLSIRAASLSRRSIGGRLRTAESAWLGAGTWRVSLSNPERVRHGISACG